MINCTIPPAKTRLSADKVVWLFGKPCCQLTGPYERGHQLCVGFAYHHVSVRLPETAQQIKTSAVQPPAGNPDNT